MNTPDKRLQAALEAHQQRMRDAEFQKKPQFGIFHPVCILAAILICGTAAVGVLMYRLATGG